MDNIFLHQNDVIVELILSNLIKWQSKVLVWDKASEKKNFYLLFNSLKNY